MGYKLRREIRDALPPGVLTAAERLLVLELADICGDETREGWPGAAKLAELTDLSERSIQETMARVGRKWVELRVPLGEKDGRVYYAHTGKRTTYRFPPPPRMEGATDTGSSDATDPGAAEPNGAMDPEERCDGSVQVVRQIRGPFPQGTSQKINTSTSPYPLEAVEVVDAEILEEGEDSTASLEHQIQELIDQVVALKPNWQTLRTDIAQQIRALLGSFGGNLDIVTGIALGTADAPDSAKPSRMTASGNPFVVAASRDLLIAKADALGSGAPFTQPHPEAHPFEPDTGGIDCTRCKFPKTNGRHKVGNQGGGYVAQRGSAYDDWQPNGRHKPHCDPQDLSEYDKPFFP